MITPTTTTTVHRVRSRTRSHTVRATPGMKQRGWILLLAHCASL